MSILAAVGILFATVYCACGGGLAVGRVREARAGSAEPAGHECCRRGEAAGDAHHSPEAPAKHHADCRHCDGTGVAPQTARAEAPGLDLAPAWAWLLPACPVTTNPVPTLAATGPSGDVPPLGKSTLLSLHCALTL